MTTKDLGDGVTEEEAWTVTWFPPDVFQRARTFNTEKKARYFCGLEDVAKSCPILEHILTVKVVTSEIVPLNIGDLGEL